MKAKVEITRGWGGDEVIKETMVSGANRNTLGIMASKWLRTNVPDPKNIKTYWTMTKKDGGVVIGYGSYTYFGRFTVLQGDTSVAKPATQTRNKTMSKKKPYSRIESGKTIRMIENQNKREIKALMKLEAPAWFIRLMEEHNAELAKLVKLRDYLWVRDTKDSEVRVSDEAKAICPKAFKLLLKQEKAMTAFCRVLYQRIEFGWPKTPGVCECKKAPAKKAPAKKAK